MSTAREVILDTETTGLDPRYGHRIVEIGCIEVMNGIPTGEHFHTYINPKRSMPQPAFAVHGLSAEFLSGHPVFHEVVEGFLTFVADAPLVIHNASFDMKFIQAELIQVKRAELNNPIVDTLTMARQKFPGAPASLDMLCKRFGIDNSKRDKHGALLDAELLAQVYLELQEGGRQPKLDLAKNKRSTSSGGDQPAARVAREPRSFFPSAEEESAHKALLQEVGSPVWKLKA